jgi:hypothetical protein
VTVAALALGSGAQADAPPAAEWSARGSDGVDARVEPLAPGSATAQRLSFDFHGGAGFALAGRALPVDFPANFIVRIPLRTSAPDSPIEVKFIDASGDNVWWYRPAPGRLTDDWQTLEIRRRQLEFAWGPTADHVPRHTERIEVVVNAGGGANTGTLDVGRIELEPLPPPPAAWPAARARAEPAGTDSAAQAAVDGDPATAWSCATGSDQTPCVLTVDYGVAREFGGLRLEWGPHGSARGYEVAISAGGDAWRSVARVTDGGAETSWLWLGEVEARFVRVSFTGAPSGRLVLAELALLDIGLGTDRNAFIRAIATASPRGEFPRGFIEQSYWTLVGRDGGSDTALLSEDGALEPGRGAPSLEPFVTGPRTVTWADAEARQRLASGYLPLPTVEWTAAGFTLSVSAVAHRGRVGEGVFARYRLSNGTAHPLSLRLVLAARPYQVNPPAQFLTTPGGVSPFGHVEWDGRTLTLDGRWRIVPITAPGAVDAFRFETQRFPVSQARLAGRGRFALTDPARLASAVLAYYVELGPHAHRDVGVFMPWGADAGSAARVSMADLEQAFASEAAFWEQRLNRVTVRAAGSAEARDVSNALRTALAHVILSRSGALLRPGTRAYARSWIRDGAMMSDALLRLGENALPREYLAAYARYVPPSGKVPCCVDPRGADPVPEHDSPGEFIHLAAAVLRATGDEPLVRSVYPQVRGAVGYIARLRAEASPPGAIPDPVFDGLLPPSISHEGYSAKPMHSYWDDFWALRGLADAAFIATRLGEPADAAAAEAAHAALARDVLRSIDAVDRKHRIDYIPGAADLGDFDATSTTIALDPGIGVVTLPRGRLEATFERYWQEFLARRDGTRSWSDYTPYEWRVVGSLVELGRPDRAVAALRYFMDGRRPAAWQQWPEVVDHEPRHARFIGDLPHGWVASDFIRSTLDLFAFDREADDAVVLAAGLPRAWLAGEGVEVRGLALRSGPLSYRAHRRGRRTELMLLAGSAVPPGGFVYRAPERARLPSARIDARPAQFEHGELRIAHVPARVTLVEP